ncbi:hypothetical protein [Acidovorax radicis]|uniref:hypothetical protein n=1 Tax=Acidovorax radicis TaxID=758826 RepID=UPI001CF9FDE2|nr:hypothetical protein [Acidovorax radicis]UCV00970.1 hypothetical protein KI609_09655 [Acidovorax radicis]
MDYSGIIEQLDSEWDTDGFFDRIRNGDYDAKQAQKILQILDAIDIGMDDLMPKRLVALLWYLPSFLGWQSDRVAERGGDRTAYAKFTVDVQNILEKMLGTP